MINLWYLTLLIYGIVLISTEMNWGPFPETTVIEVLYAEDNLSRIENVIVLSVELVVLISTPPAVGVNLDQEHLRCEKPA